MKQIFASIAVIGLLVSSTYGCAQNQRITGSKKYITKEVTISNYTAIQLMGSPDVIYTQSDKGPALSIYGSDNIVPLLETTVKDGVLCVNFKKGVNVNNPGKLEIRTNSALLTKVTVQGSGNITLANGIKGNNNLSVTILGSGDIKGSDINCNKLAISIQGSGDIQLKKVTANRTEANVAGSGDIVLTGTTTDASFNIAGSGDITASNLEASDVSASIAGSGDISCYATNSIKAYVNGSGTIGYKGNPQEKDFSKKGIRKL